MNAVFWDVTPCGSCNNRRFGGSYRVHHQALRSVLRLLVTANIVPSSPILGTLMMEAIRFSETSVLRRAARRNTSEDSILHNSFLLKDYNNNYYILMWQREI
jgi:hypothetical protein